MKSHFPGMDPYLESRWSDVHAALVFLTKEALQPNLPPALRARTEERVLLETVANEPMHQYRPDVAVVDTGRSGARAAVASSPTAAVESFIVRRHDGPIVDRFIQIIDVTSGNRVVTAIEILSPWNKAPGRLNREYLEKLDDYARGGVSVVEIDLLRYPPRGRLAITEGDIPVNRRTPYLVCIRRSWLPDEWEVCPISLRQPLPRIPIPLRRSDGDIGLELQPLIGRVYVSGGHDDIDYRRPLDPPLGPEDAAWADELLKTAGKR